MIRLMHVNKVHQTGSLSPSAMGPIDLGPDRDVAD